MSAIIRFKRGNSANWISNGNLVLSSGEPGYEVDTGRIKIGNGITPWSGLYYSSVIPTGFINGSGISIDLGPRGSTATIAVSGLIHNPSNNRVLTSRDNTTTGIDAETNLIFDGNRLGINTTTPSGNLHVVGSGIVSSVTGLVANAVLNLYSATSGDTVFNVAGSNGNLFSVTNNLTGSLLSVNNTFGLPLFQISNNPIISGGRFNQNDFILTSGGKLGLNTNNPLYKLHVNDSGYFASGLYVSGLIVCNTGYLDRLIFNTGLADPDLITGQLQWNGTEGTLDLGLDNNYAMHLGEEMLYRVRNITGSTLRAGQPVYASGLSPGGNNRIEVNLYAADGNIREIRFMGLITENLPDNGSNGYATHFGYIRGINTNGGVTTDYTDKLWVSGEPSWNEGDILYVHPSVPGKLTKIEPKHSISVAIVTNKSNNGKLFVRPTSYGHLGDNHDVNVSGVTNGQFLQYDSATDYWIPSSTGSFTGLNVQNLDVVSTGDINVLKINQFYHNNLSVAPGISDNDLLLTIIDPTGSPSTQVIRGDILRNSLLNQPAVLRFRQGTEIERLLITPASGEPLWTTDSQKFYIGDGSTVGGDFVGPGPYTYTSSGINNIIVLDSTNSIWHPSGQDYNTISNGLNNTIFFTSGIYNSIYNGENNTISSNTTGAVFFDSVTSRGANTIINGKNNTISNSRHSSILNGINNSITGSTNIILGGVPWNINASNHSISGNQNLIGLGNIGAITGNHNTILNGGLHGLFITTSPNTIISNYSTIINGFLNTIRSSTTGTFSSDSMLSYIGVGWSNTINRACYNSCILGGSFNTIQSGFYPIGGLNAGAFGSLSGLFPYQTIGGGRENTATGPYSTIPGGNQAKTTRYGEISHGAGHFASRGDAQHTILVARGLTTNSTPNQQLFLNGSSRSFFEPIDRKLTIPLKTSWVFEIKLTAYCDTNDTSAWWIFRGGIKNINGTISFIGSPIKEYGQDAGLSLTDANIEVDNIDGALSILVTGEIDKNIRWVAVIDISQVSYGTP